MLKAYFIGVDIGTQGARVNLIDEKGNLIAIGEKIFVLDASSREEQSPLLWEDAFHESLSKMLQTLPLDFDRSKIISIGVTSTSGTVIPMDKSWNPLHNAIMYSDKRSAPQALKCKAAAEESNQNFTAFSFSTGLAKMVWFSETYPEKEALIHKWIHAADFIVGKISGVWAVTDYTNAFKSGYDILNYSWPEYIHQKFPIKKEWLPEVVAPGEVIGFIDKNFAEKCQLPKTIKIIAGITDGCASQIAAGAVNPGEWNTTIGTTLVIKGVSKKEIKDPFGRIYSHRHPLGYWMPGGASNTGADWVTNEFGKDLISLNQYADEHLPGKHLSYPLRQKGERFPFIAPQAEGFEPEGLSYEERFLANMEGVAYIERYSYQVIEELSGETVKAVFTAGGASNSNTWLKIRSNTLNVPIYKMKYVTGAFGAAMLAASNTFFRDLPEAVEKLTQIDKEVYPELALSNHYNNNYYRFLTLLADKGYILKEELHNA
jgi:sugar (pentulose or hexulose) kinase